MSKTRIAPFRKQGGGTEDEKRMQSNSENAFLGFRDILILNGAYIENVSVGTTETLIAHKLGRPMRGFIICNNNTLCTVASTTGTFNKNLFVGLKASVACTLSLWIF